MNVTQDLSIIELISHASLVVKLVMLLLTVVSLQSWYWIFRKWFSIRDAKKKTDLFERDFWSGGDLNALYQAEPALHRGDCSSVHGEPGMRWVESHDSEHSVFSWLRYDPTGEARPVLIVVNATPSPQWNYRLGVPSAGHWRELLNSDAEMYGGSGMGNHGGVDTAPLDSHGFHQSIVVTLPPLGALALALD